MEMNEVKLKRKKRLFKINESGYHRSAKEILASWVNGIIEEKFYVDGKIVFVPDVTVYENGVVKCIYEVIHKNQFTGHKYGLMQYYCYKNFTTLTVYEISSDYILEQTQKPQRIKAKECYTIDMFEYEEIQDELIIAKA
jgi:hypothetical protein